MHFIEEREREAQTDREKATVLLTTEFITALYLHTDGRNEGQRVRRGFCPTYK